MPFDFIDNNNAIPPNMNKSGSIYRPINSPLINYWYNFQLPEDLASNKLPHYLNYNLQYPLNLQYPRNNLPKDKGGN